MSDPAAERQRREPLTRDHLAPGTQPEDVDAAPDPAAGSRRAALDQSPRHAEDTRGSGPVAERDHLHGPDQNPR